MKRSEIDIIGEAIESYIGSFHDDLFAAIAETALGLYATGVIDGETLQSYLVETGPELLKPREREEHISDVSNSVKHFKGDEGRHRFVKYDTSGTPIAALEVRRNRWDGKTRIANVYTSNEHRRQGHATELFKHAKSKFPRLAHSTDLTDSGKAWKKSLRGK